MLWDHPGSELQQWLKMGRSSLYGLDLLEGPFWSVMPLEAMLVSVAHAAALSHDKACGPCEHVQCMLLIDALVISSGFAAFRGHLDVSDM